MPLTPLLVASAVLARSPAASAAAASTTASETDEGIESPFHQVEQDLRFLAFQATPLYSFPGAAGVKRWDQVCTVAPGAEPLCDLYSVGTGHCVVQTALRSSLGTPTPLAKENRSTVELLQSYNCRVQYVEDDAFAAEDPLLFEEHNINVTVPLQLFHCPKAVPISLFLIPKCGSTSAVNWAFAMEGPADRASLTRASEYLLLNGSQRFMDWLTEELQISFLLSGLAFDGEEASQTLDLSAKLFNRSLYRLSFGHKPRKEGDPLIEHYVTPAHLCPMCCVHGHGRLRVIMGRNPYVRLASYFRFRWLNLADGSYPRTRWVDFAPWLASILGFRAARPEVFANKLQWTPRLYENGSCNGVPKHLEQVCWEARALALDDHDIFHLRPLADFARDARHPAGLQIFFPGVHVIHLETVEKDVTAMEKRLCKEFQYCKPLPAFPEKVQPSGHTPSERTLMERCLLNEATLEWSNCTAPPWLELWPPQLVDMVSRAYNDDFRVLGYSTDPAMLLPISAQ